MASLKIKKGDTVKVIAGKDKDKEGKVLSVKDGKVIVEGINMITKHAKPSMANQQGGIINKEAPIDASNVMLIHNGKAVRVGFKVEDGKKVRVAKGSNEVIVSGSLQLHQTCPQMANGITAHDQSMVLFRSLINCLVQSGYNLRTGL